MSAERKPEILVSNMSIPYLAAVPLELTGLTAKFCLGADGIEYVPTKVGVAQTNLGRIGRTAYIRAAHENWRSEPAGREGMQKVWETRKQGLGKLGASLATWALMPNREDTEDHLGRLEKVVGYRLPVVLYLEFHAENEIAKIDFEEKSVQITPELLTQKGITSAQQMEDVFTKWGILPTIDTVHSVGIDEKILAKALEMTHEIHVSVDRLDLGTRMGNMQQGMDILQEAPNLERVVVEAVAFPWKINHIVKEIKGKI